jgi:hypothetical protein
MSLVQDQFPWSKSLFLSVFRATVYHRSVLSIDHPKDCEVSSKVGHMNLNRSL